MSKQLYFKQFSLAHKSSSISTNSVYHMYAVSMSKTVLFQVIQCSISTEFSSMWPIDRTLSDTTNQDKSEPGSDGNEGVLHIFQSSSITGTLPSDCFVSYPSAEIQSVYSTAPAD